jgi:hypothetical protein
MDPMATYARRARLQLIAAIVFATLLVLALVIPVWIEELTGLSPDGGNGEFELLLAVPFGVLSVAFGILTWRSRRLLAGARLSP